MYNVILTVHTIVCVLLILVVLIQAGRSGGLSGLMGGGGGDALFSTASQQSGLRKMTVIMAIIFMSTSLMLTILSSRQSGQSVFQRQLPQVPPINVPAAEKAPAANQSAPAPK